MTQTQVIERAGILLHVDFLPACGPDNQITFNTIRVLDENYRPCGPNLVPLLDPAFVLCGTNLEDGTPLAERLLQTIVTEVTQ